MPYSAVSTSRPATREAESPGTGSDQPSGTDARPEPVARHPPRLTFLPDVLAQHVEELGFLFGRWRSALNDPDHTIRSVGELEERIRAHLEGIRAVGDHSHPLLVEALRSEDEDVAFAGAYALLHEGSGALSDLVFEGFEFAGAEAREPLGMALAYAPLPPAGLERLCGHLGAEDPALAIAAPEVLAFHGALELSGEQLRYFLQHDDALVRARSWRLAGRVGASLSPKAYAAALRDDDPAVTDAALETGAWCGEKGTLLALRRLADEEPSPDRLDRLYLLAVLAGAEDVPVIRQLVGAESLGPDRFRLAGACGDPGLVEMILERLEDPDPAIAAAAGGAFTRLTGVDIESDEAATVPPADGGEPDEFEAEFLEEVLLPDAERARVAWDELGPRLRNATRLCRGHDMGQPLPAEAFEALDMESRRELFLRCRFHGTWTGTRIELERFPQLNGGRGGEHR